MAADRAAFLAKYPSVNPSIVVGSWIPMPSATVNASTDVWTTAFAHGLATGDPVSFATTGTLPASTPQIAAGTTYYVSVASASTTQFTVFTTAANATAGTNPIDFTSAGTGTLTVTPLNPSKLSNSGENVEIVDANGAG